MKISIIRGAFLNPFELQNYYPLSQNHDVQAVSSLNPINSQIKLPLKKLLSPTDLPDFPFKYSVLNRIFKDAHYLFGLEEIIKEKDIVHVAETYYNYTLQAIKAKRKGLVKKVISTVWEIIPFNNEGLPGRRGIKKIARKEVDHFITPTKLAKEALIKEGVPTKKITVIPMGVNLNRFKPSKIHRLGGDITILFIGRLEESKGVLNLVKAFTKLNKSIPNLKLNIIGQGTLKEKITNHKNITLKTVPYNKIHQEYQKADIFCLPSQETSTWQEQYGMVLVEAMASGLPIVTTNTGAIKEVCGKAVLYVPQKSPIHLTRALEKLILDQPLRHRLSSLALKRAKKHYDYCKAADRIEAVYQDLF